jgi:hypothetical protein
MKLLVALHWKLAPASSELIKGLELNHLPWYILQQRLHRSRGAEKYL